eukprot:Lithocolla_globosa_v1_NODE_265_length_4744_cov_7.305396.p6 type:complete len:147 gc:universal NODE_265_length_4744_cov_7.305396:1323-1763(+)
MNRDLSCGRMHISSALSMRSGHHLADSQSGATSVSLVRGVIFPIVLAIRSHGGFAQLLSLSQCCTREFTASSSMSLNSELYRRHIVLACEAKRSIVWGPHLLSNRRNMSRWSFQSLLSWYLERPSALQLSLLLSHSHRPNMLMLFL